MGEVWLGSNASDESLAFKLLRPEMSEDTDIIRRFFSERKLLTSVQHQNVVRVYDLVAEGTTLAIVMEYVDGSDLRHRLREKGTLEPEEACLITAQVAHGLDAIHRARIVHRDVKPANVLLGGDPARPDVKLTDFGVARLAAEGMSEIGSTTLVGTPSYLAPEAINGAIPGPPADFYALGLMLYELLCGIGPFAGMPTGPLLQAHRTLKPGRPDGLDDAVWDLIRQLVAKDPTRRPVHGVAEHLERLASAQSGRPALAPIAQPPTPTIDVAASNRAINGRGADVTMVALADASASTPSSRPSRVVVPPAPRPPAVEHVAASAGAVQHRSRTPLLLGVIAGLAVLVIALIVFVVFNGANRTDTAGSGAGSAGATSATPSQAGQSSASAMTWPPTGALACPDRDSVAVNPATTCQFAYNVSDAYIERGSPGVVSAYSPVTGNWYDMSCDLAQASIVVCTGGNDAKVYLRQ